MASVDLPILERAAIAASARFSRGEEPPPPTHPPLDTIGDRKSPFIHRTEKKTLDRRGKEVPIEQETGGIPPELKKDFADSLKEQINILRGLQKDHPDVFNRLMDQQEYLSFRDLYNKVVHTKEGSGSVGGHEMNQFDDAVFDAYMATDAGFATAYEMRLLKLQETMIQSGEFLDMNLGAPDPRMIRNQTVRTGSGGESRELVRNFLNFMGDPRRNFGRETPHRPHTKGGATATVTSMSAIFGAIGSVGGPLGFAAGVGIPPALASIVYSLRPGERINITEAQEALALAQGVDPVRREWARVMYGVDSRNLEVNAAGHVQIRADILAGDDMAMPAKSPEDVRDILVTDYDKILEAQKAFGIRRQMRNAMDLVGVTPGQRQQFIQRDMPLETLVQRQFLETFQIGGVNAYIFNAAGEYVANPAFHWAALTAAQRQEAWNFRQGIHRDLLTHKINQDFGDITEWGKDRRADLFGEIIKAKERHPQTVEQLKRQLTEEDGHLSEDQTRLSREAPHFTAIETTLTEVGNKRRTAERTRNNVIGVTAHPTGETDAVTLLNYVLNDTAGGFELDVVDEGVRLRVTSIAAREAQALTTYQNELANVSVGLPPGKPGEKAADAKINVAEKTYNAAIALIDKDKKAIQTALTAINTANREETEAFNGFNGLDADREAVQTVTTEMQTARTTVENWSIPPGFLGIGVDLSTAVLQNESFNEIMNRINLTNGLDPTRGWAVGENRDVENRSQVLNAMIEARASLIDPRITTPSIAFEGFTDPNLFGFYETELLTLSSETILNRINDTIARAAPGSPLFGFLIVPNTMNLINEAKNDAQARFSARSRARQEMDRNITNRKTLLERQRERVDRDNTETPELDAVERAAGRLDQVNSTIATMPVAQLFERLDPALAGTQPDLYLPAEQANSIAYANMMEWIFNHRDDMTARNAGETGREAAFARNSNYLTPDVLRDLLIQEFPAILLPPLPAGAAGPAIAPATFEIAIDMLRQEIQNGNLSPVLFAQFVTENVIYGYMAPRVPVL